MNNNPNFNGQKKVATKYFVKKKNDKEVIRFTRNFKENASRFFGDCDKLKQNILNEKDGFRKKDIVHIVDFYNNECEN